MKDILTKHRWLPYALIALAGFFLYLRTLSFGYTFFDDDVLILEKSQFLKDPANIVRIFRQDVFCKPDSLVVFYRPLLTLSFMLDAMVGGESPFIYHLTNILVHILASWLVFSLLLKLRSSRDTSLVLALIFTVHPLLAQAVAWIPGRNDSLLAVFVLSSFILFMKFLEEGKNSLYGLHLAFFLCALFTKESSVMLAAICALYAYLVRPGKYNSFKKIYPIFGWALVITFWLWLRRCAIGGAAGINSYEMAKSFSLNIAAAALYIGKSVFPFNLSIFPVMKDIAPAYGILAVILLAAGVVLTKDKDRPLAVFGIFWFLLFLLPAFFRPIPEIVAPHLDFSEHRVYVPIIGILIVISQIGVVKRFDVTKIPQAALAFLLMIFFSAISFGHSGAFKDRMSFAAKAVAASPHAAWARVSLGTVYYLGGDLEKAEAEHKKALELNPHQPMAHVKLGVIYEGRGLTAEAEKEFRKEIAINPLYDGTWVALGALYYKKGRFREAEGAWLTALELNPDNPAARNNLAVCRKSI